MARETEGSAGPLGGSPAGDEATTSFPPSIATDASGRPRATYAEADTERGTGGASADFGGRLKDTAAAASARASDAASRAGETLKGAVRQTRRGVESLADDPTVREVADRTRGVATQVAEEVREAASSLFEEQKMRAAEAVQGIAEVLHRTADTMNREQMPMAELADRAAGHIEAFSARVRDRHWSELMAETESFARRQPALFLAGAVALGFAVGRFMLASPEREREFGYEPQQFGEGGRP
jgi:hypothetical protein